MLVLLARATDLEPCIIDWVGHPLCGACVDWHLDKGGGPYEPSALALCATHLWLSKWLPKAVTGHLA